MNTNQTALKDSRVDVVVEEVIQLSELEINLIAGGAVVVNTI